MIREVETLEGRSMPASQLAAAPPMTAELVEREINRLTWSVLDGRASANDRHRLAELVKVQHSLRPRAG
jgi:hypothetical protein